MNTKDLFNNDLTTSIEEVDRINKQFYGQYNYPWPPLIFEAHLDKGLYDLLNQELGYYQLDRLPRNSKIWVAGCGTNQAVFTALRYPDSKIIATDISSESLHSAKTKSLNLGIGNIQFIEKSILNSEFLDEFDYILCTGVIHHTANPSLALQQLTKGLKKDGVIELMVYNYYHRLTTTACQKAIKQLVNLKGDFTTQLSLTKKLVRSYELPNLMGDFLSSYKYSGDEELADSLIQPVEFSYTVASLGQMLIDNNLEYIAPCVNQFDKERNTLNWNMAFGDQDLSHRYNTLKDEERWQVTNLLLLNESPMLWFYLQKRESSFKKKNEFEICEDFLKSKFEKFSTIIQSYHRTNEGMYISDSKPKIFPLPQEPSDELARKIFNHHTSNVVMSEIFKSANMSTDFHTVNLTRLNLTTPLNPYLVASKS